MCVNQLLLAHWLQSLFLFLCMYVLMRCLITQEGFYDTYEEDSWRENSMFLGGVFNVSKVLPSFHHNRVVLLVYVIARAGVKFGINVMRMA